MAATLLAATPRTIRPTLGFDRTPHSHLLGLGRRVCVDDVGKRDTDHLGLQLDAGVVFHRSEEGLGVGVLREKVGQLRAVEGR